MEWEKGKNGLALVVDKMTGHGFFSTDLSHTFIDSHPAIR
jgi:hypothetical protein